MDLKGLGKYELSSADVIVIREEHRGLYTKIS